MAKDRGIHIRVRLSNALYDKIAEAAKDHGQSVSAEVVKRLTLSLEGRETDKQIEELKAEFDKERYGIFDALGSISRTGGTAIDARRYLEAFYFNMAGLKRREQDAEEKLRQHDERVKEQVENKPKRTLADALREAPAKEPKKK